MCSFGLYIPNRITYPTVVRSEMILQHLILPSTECGDYRLYTDRDVKGFPIELLPEESIEFRGFMNAFSLDKWGKYTDIGSLKLSLECTGRYSVELHTELWESSSECENDSVIDVPDMIETGLLCVRITAITDTSILSGSYVSDAEPEHARIAFDVCTYRRPEYIEKKKETFLKAMDYDGLSKNAEMFIVDNASELDTSTSDPRIHVFHNPNTGGSGGISRGIEEIHKAGGFTHIVMMDDDTVLEPECLYRTWSFVSCLKDGYKDVAMAGTMLLADDGCVVYESGAVFRSSTDNIARCRPLKHRLDVSEDAGCTRFNLPEEIDYGGWWYCVYPASFARPDNLPLRLFMRYDDVEYGLRFRKEFVTMNGMASAVGIITGKTIGAGKTELMKEYARTTQILFFVVGLLTGATVFLLKTPFISMYSEVTPETAGYARQFCNVLSVTSVGSCYQAACLFGLVKSGGDIDFVFRNDTIFVLLVVLPSALFAARLGAPAWVVFACLKCDQILKCIVAFFKINSFNWMRNLTRDTGETEDVA